MTFPKVRVVVSLCLFLSWLGFLLFLVLERKSVILSQPQFLIAQVIVVAELRDDNGFPDPEVLVKEVLWSADPADRQLQKMVLLELPRCGKKEGYHGAGVYVIPLVKRGARFAIAPLPAFGPESQTPRIYLLTEETRAQVEEIIAAK